MPTFERGVVERGKLEAYAGIFSELDPPLARNKINGEMISGRIVELLHCSSLMVMSCSALKNAMNLDLAVNTDWSRFPSSMLMS